MKNKNKTTIKEVLEAKKTEQVKGLTGAKAEAFLQSNSKKHPFKTKKQLQEERKRASEEVLEEIVETNKIAE